MQRPLRKLKPSALLLSIMILLQFQAAFAQDNLSDSLVMERLQTIQRMLERGKPNSNLWWYGWLAGYGAATVAQGTVGLTSKDKDTRQDMALGAATTFLGAMGQIVEPMTPGSAPDKLAVVSENTPDERKAKLAQAESLLRECAQREKDGRSWKTHVLTGAVNAAGGLVVWLGFKRSFWEGAANFALNTAVTEIQIWSQPTRAIEDYQDYLRQCQSGGTVQIHKSGKFLSLNAGPVGFGIRLSF